MTTIGAGWIKHTESGKQYISIKIDVEILPLTITQDRFLTLFEIAEEDRKKENSPHYRLVMSKSDEDKPNKKTT